MTGGSHDVKTAVVVAVAMFVLYNANGREIGNYDSQPTKYAARELLRRGAFSLNHVVGKTPELTSRSGFVLARDGRYRSAYSPMPALLAAGLMWPLLKLHVFALDAPLAPALISSVASSFFVALAIALVFLTARRFTSRGRALFVAVAAGAGTGLWSTASQTLWQHESAIFGLMLAVFGLSSASMRMRHAVTIGVGLGIAAASRMQLAPALAVLLVATFLCGNWRQGLAAGLIAAAIVSPILVLNQRWFGSFIGAGPMLEALHWSVHWTKRTSFQLQPEGFAGLLWSPNRGLLIFSPVVAFVAAGVVPAARGGWKTPAALCLLAALAQFLLYGSYSVWWGGYTYGPRYMLDLLPLLVPAASLAAERIRRPVVITLAVIALAVSISTAAVGAFCYPNDRWNSEPNIDRYHHRLWDWSDNQIRRAWLAGPSPQNFMLFTRDAFRAPRP